MIGLDDLRIHEEMTVLFRQGILFALATVVENAGSSPNRAGAKMLVREDDSILATPASYIYFIGSKRKREVRQQTLIAEAYAPDDLDRLTIPVGLAIGAGIPVEISVSIVAQLIQARRKHAASVGDTPGGRAVAEDGTLQATAAAP